MAVLADPGKRRGRKRGDGEGTFTQRSDGLWRARLMVGRKPDGKPDVRTVYAKTRGEVQDKLDALRRRSKGGMLSDAEAERESVADFLTRWLEAKRSTIRPRTWIRYEEFVRLHLVPTLGKIRLSALRPAALVKLYTDKHAAGLSPRTIHHLHTVLHTALEAAVKWGHVPRNVADAVDPPSVPKREMRPPTPSEVARLLDAAIADEDRFAPLWTVAVYSGCRQGELLGLKWDDVNLEKGTLHVRRSLIGANAGVPQFGEPKTKGSRRLVSLPTDAVATLHSQRAKQREERLLVGAEYAPYGLVFATSIGTPLLMSNVFRAFKKALARAGLPRTIRMHDLRHASATLALAGGVAGKVVSSRLGHSNIGTTLDLYTHDVDGLDSDAAARIQEVVRLARAAGSQLGQ